MTGETARNRVAEMRQRVLIVLVVLFTVGLCVPSFSIISGWSAAQPHYRVPAQPVALLDTPSAWFLIDENGTVRGTVARDEAPSLPKLFGIRPTALLMQEFQALNATRTGIEVATLLIALDTHNSEVRDVQLDLSDARNIVATIRGMTVYLGDGRFREKWDLLEHVRDAGHAIFRAGHELDLRFSDTVIVRRHL